jgi:hypothetical protein
MGILSLCADSARPPGTTTLLEDYDGSCITLGYRYCDKRYCYMAPKLHAVSDHRVTTYYSTHDTYPSSPLHLAPQSSLHVISALTCNTITLAQRHTRTPIPICNWFDKQWLTAVSPKNNNFRRNNTNNNGITPHHDCLPDNTHTSNMTMTNLWISLSLLLCILLLSTFFISRPRTKRNRNRTTATPRRRRYPLRKPPGTRTKYGKMKQAWNIIYDPQRDEVLTWTHGRVRIYQRRSPRQFVYQKEKTANTFPRHAQPIHGHWNGCSFIVTDLDHWTNTPMAASSTPLYPAPQSSLHDISALTCPTITLAQRQPRTPLPTGKWFDKTPRNNPNLTTKYLTRHLRKSNNTTSKDSQWSMKKWQPQARIKIQWTQQHLDAYLALAETRCEWNIEPG